MKDGIKVRVQNTIFAFSWKVKAIRRRLQLKALNKRFDEVMESRDGWKKKATEKQEEILKLKNDIQFLQKGLDNLSKKKL